jgi:pimeloyl-ACP methyl ester carboxylesterase
MFTTSSSLHLIYLHGWEEHPTDSPVAAALRAELPNAKIHYMGYHPGGDVRATRVTAALQQLGALVDDPKLPPRVRLMGYSFGGLVAALFAAQRPERIAKVLLLAPAIDNIARNYPGEASTWRMPADYVADLRGYPARPKVVCPTTLVYGDLENDREGSAPTRYREWARAEPFERVVELPGVDHELAPLLQGETTPTFAELIADLMAVT